MAGTDIGVYAEGDEVTNAVDSTAEEVKAGAEVSNGGGRE